MKVVVGKSLQLGNGNKRTVHGHVIDLAAKSTRKHAWLL